MHTINDVPALGAYFFCEPDLDSKAAALLYKSVSPAVYRMRCSFCHTTSLTLRTGSALEDASAAIEALPEAAFDEASTHIILEALNSLSGTGTSRSAKELMSPLRHALTGQKVSSETSRMKRCRGLTIRVRRSEQECQRPSARWVAKRRWRGSGKHWRGPSSRRRASMYIRVAPFQLRSRRSSLLLVAEPRTWRTRPLPQSPPVPQPADTNRVSESFAPLANTARRTCSTSLTSVNAHHQLPFPPSSSHRDSPGI